MTAQLKVTQTGDVNDKFLKKVRDALLFLLDMRLSKLMPAFAGDC